MAKPKSLKSRHAHKSDRIKPQVKVQRPGSGRGKKHSFNGFPTTKLVLVATATVLICSIVAYRVLLRDDSTHPERSSGVSANASKTQNGDEHSVGSRHEAEGSEGAPPHGAGQESAPGSAEATTGSEQSEVSIDSDGSSTSNQKHLEDSEVKTGEKEENVAFNKKKRRRPKDKNDSAKRKEEMKEDKTKLNFQLEERTATDGNLDPVERERIANFKSEILNSLNIRDIEVDGRMIKAQELKGDKPNNSSVRVYMYENFLTPRECHGLMAVHNKHVKEADKDGPIVCFNSVVTLRKHLQGAGKDIKVSERDFTPGTTCVNASFSQQLGKFIKWSYSTSFYSGESKFSTRFETRVEQATGLNPSNGGKFQITSYPYGVGYKTHTDCVVGSTEERDRYATILVYLQDVHGGQTTFPELGIRVKPRQGRAIVWNNMDADGNCEPMSIHSADIVDGGHKYIIQRWYYYKSFYALGKRSEEPDLPSRVPGQPRVSCDAYDVGSCRWYDEWNMDHIVEYLLTRRKLD